jgi:hypothetical protein
LENRVFLSFFSKQVFYCVSDCLGPVLYMAQQSASQSWEWEEEEEFVTEEASEGGFVQKQNTVKVADVTIVPRLATPVSSVTISPPVVARVAPHNMSESGEWEEEDQEESQHDDGVKTAPSIKMPAAPVAVVAPVVVTPVVLVAPVKTAPAAYLPSSPVVDRSVPPPIPTVERSAAPPVNAPVVYGAPSVSVVQEVKNQNIRCPHCGENVSSSKQHLAGRKFRNYARYTFEDTCSIQ